MVVKAPFPPSPSTFFICWFMSFRIFLRKGLSSSKRKHYYFNGGIDFQLGSMRARRMDMLSPSATAWKWSWNANRRAAACWTRHTLKQQFNCGSQSTGYERAKGSWSPQPTFLATHIFHLVPTVSCWWSQFMHPQYQLRLGRALSWHDFRRETWWSSSRGYLGAQLRRHWRTRQSTYCARLLGSCIVPSQPEVLWIELIKRNVVRNFGF